MDQDKYGHILKKKKRNWNKQEPGDLVDFSIGQMNAKVTVMSAKILHPLLQCVMTLFFLKWKNCSYVLSSVKSGLPGLSNSWHEFPIKTS